MKLKVDEYLLGKAQSTSTTDKEREEEKEDEDGKQKLKSTEKLPTFYYNGKSYAYHEIEMEQGTICDISNEPRSIKIKYICDVDAHQSGTVSGLVVVCGDVQVFTVTVSLSPPLPLSTPYMPSLF